MNYSLIVITHGDSAPLQDTLHSFLAAAYPRPSQIDIVYDGNTVEDFLRLDGIAQALANENFEVLVRTSDIGQQGFCHATKRAWAAGQQSPNDFVFYLEHDFRFKRPLELAHMANVLTGDKVMAQMSLMRQPCNQIEQDRGGVVGAYGRDTFERCQYTEGTTHWYLEHTHYFTTNPSLMRTEFMRKFNWPDGPACEGKMGLHLRDVGCHFGIWGQGEEWIEHIGQRNGKGY